MPTRIPSTTIISATVLRDLTKGEGWTSEESKARGSSVDDEWEIDSSGLKPIKRLKRGPGSFLGGKIKYGAPTESELKERKKILSSGQDSHGIAKQWSGRLPICPY